MNAVDAGLASVVVAGIAATGSLLAARIASHAAKNTKPISNGWSSDTTRRLDRIEALIITHIQAHADADVASRKK